MGLGATVGKNLVMRLMRKHVECQTDPGMLDAHVHAVASQRISQVMQQQRAAAASADAVTAKQISDALAMASDHQQAKIAERGRDPSIQLMGTTMAAPVSYRPRLAAVESQAPVVDGGAATTSRPATALSLGRVYPSSLTAGVAASNTFASMPRTKSTPTCARTAAAATATPFAAYMSSGAGRRLTTPTTPNHAGSGPLDAYACASDRETLPGSRPRTAAGEAGRPGLALAGGDDGGRGGASGCSAAAGCGGKGSSSASSSKQQKPQFKGPLPMVRLVQGFNQSTTPMRLYAPDGGSSHAQLHKLEAEMLAAELAAVEHGSLATSLRYVAKEFHTGLGDAYHDAPKDRPQAQRFK